MNYKTNSKFKKSVFLSAAIIAGAACSDIPKAHGQTITCTPSGMLFGTLIPCAVANTATLNTTGSVSATGCLSAGAGPTNAPICVAQRTSFGPIQFSVTAASINVNNGGNSMAVDSFRCLAGSVTCNISTSTFFLTIPIGARLSVGANQASGTYSGTFTVNANFP